MHRRRNFKPKSATVATSNEDSSTPIVADTPVVAAFRQYARELDAKHDRYERIVKRSRDITIESKRIIFLLHTVKPMSPDAAILTEAGNRLRTLATTSFAAIAGELQGIDAHQFMRAYSAGLQEFIEALTFWQYVTGVPLYDWLKVADFLKTKQCNVPAVVSEMTGDTFSDTAAAIEVVDLAASSTTDKEVTSAPLSCPVDAMEYMQGLGDLGGEVMRQCIGALGAGDFETCFRGCAFLRAMNTGYNSMLFNQRNRNLSTKMITLRQSLLKVEHVCYNIKVRGKEAGTLALLDAGDTVVGGDDDEGFSNF